MSHPGESSPALYGLGESESNKPALLAEIRGLLGELSRYSEGTEYHKGVLFQFGTEEDCFNEVDVVTSRNGEGDVCGIEVNLSYLDAQGGRRCAIATLEQSDDETWLPNFRGDLTSEELLRLTPASLPAAIGNVISFTHAASSRTEGVSAVGLWQAAETVLDELGASLTYSYRYDTTIDGHEVSVDAAGVLPRPGDTEVAEEWSDYGHMEVRLPGVFKFVYSSYRGFVEENFDDALDTVYDDKLPQLTDEQLERRPYTVVYSYIPGLEEKFARLPFKVVPVIRDGRLVRRVLDRAATEEEAWQMADLLYMRKLAMAKISRDLTPARLERVRGVLDAVLSDARAKTASPSTVSKLS